MLATMMMGPALMLSAGQAGMEDLDLLDKRVAAIADAQGGHARPIDRRIKLARCPQPAMIERRSAFSLAVRCPQLGWRIRVNLARPQRLDAANPALAGGGVPIVRRGEAVEIRVSAARFSVSTTAVAMEDGKLGDSIRIKSGRSKTPLVARVLRRGVVEISN